MTEQQYIELVALLTEKLNQLVFLNQVLCLAACCTSAFAVVQLIIHTKNQKHMF